LASSPYALYLVVDGEDYVVSYGSCRRSRTGFEEYCYDQSDYVDCQKGKYECPEIEEHDNNTNWCCPYDVKNVKFSGGEAYWGAHVTFTELGKPDIELTRETSPDDLLALSVNEEVSVTLNFKNKGERALTGGRFTEQLPPGFSFLPDSSDTLFTWAEGLLTLKVNLNPGDEKAYRYVLRPVRYAEGVLNGTFTYTVNGEERRIFPKPITLKAPEPYTLTQILTPQRILDDETSEYVLLVNNTGAKKLNVSVQLFGFFDFLPSLSGFTRTGHTYEGTEELDVGEFYNLTLTLDPPEAGWYSLRTVVSPATSERSYLETWDSRLVVTRRTLTPILVLPEEIHEGEPFTVRAIADNTGSQTDFTILGATLTSTHFDEEQGKGGVVLAGTTRDLLEASFTAPNVTGNITFTLTGEYREEGKEQQTFREEKRVLVVPETLHETAGAEPGSTGTTGSLTGNLSGNLSGNLTASNETNNTDTGPDEVPSGGFIVRFLNRLAAWLKSFF
ncbi:DUF11 domain-containing protein, partial [Candidatus Woesearchaeota archaeon]